MKLRYLFVYTDGVEEIKEFSTSGKAGDYAYKERDRTARYYRLPNKRKK